MSDVETQSGNEHEPSDNVNDDVHVARNHGKEREPWVADPPRLNLTPP